MAEANDLTSAVAEMLAQERGGDVAPAKPAATAPAPASEANAEQPTEHQTDAPKGQPEGAVKPTPKPSFDPDALTPEQVNAILSRNKVAQAELYRKAQSMKDKEIARLRQEQDAQRKRDEERRELEELDDEDFGRRIREQQRMDALISEHATARMLPVLGEVQSTALSKLSDAQIRAQIQERITSGEFTSLGQILDAVLESETDARAQKAIAKMETKLRKEIREAIEKERTAEAADDDDAPPVIGSGLPTGSRELHGTALLAAGVADMRREARKRK